MDFQCKALSSEDYWLTVMNAPANEVCLLNMDLNKRTDQWIQLDQEAQHYQNTPIAKAHQHKPNTGRFIDKYSLPH